jgi:hypothetical protein
MTQKIIEHPFLRFWRDENARNNNMGLTDASHGQALTAWEALPFVEQTLFYSAQVTSQDEFFDLFM